MGGKGNRVMRNNIILVCVVSIITVLCLKTLVERQVRSEVYRIIYEVEKLPQHLAALEDQINEKNYRDTACL